ncbi:uncharacterized protein LOC144004116 [Festucalex cinctus]
MPGATQIATTTIAPAIIIRRVSFRSLQSTFTNNLLNQSSPEFVFRATMIRSQLQPLFQREFPTIFRILIIIGFRRGSVINDMDLQFSNRAPNNTAIAAVLTDAVSVVSGFDIEQGSVTVEGIVSSGTSHKISLLSAFCLALLSWISSGQQ